MSTQGASLVWSPRSNVSLYGDTALVSVYKRMGVNVALGTDWLPTGSMNLLRELNREPATNGPREQVYCTKVGTTRPDETVIYTAHHDHLGATEGTPCSDLCSGVNAKGIQN